MTAWLAETLEKKAALVEAYKSNLGSIDCVHFKLGEGTCPFGTRCVLTRFLLAPLTPSR